MLDNPDNKVAPDERGCGLEKLAPEIGSGTHTLPGGMARLGSMRLPGADRAGGQGASAAARRIATQAAQELLIGPDRLAPSSCLHLDPANIRPHW
ncbi:MAG TPA: hypothetical protein VIZ17_18050 [Acetobacteraceae bacterium]